MNDKAKRAVPTTSATPDGAAGVSLRPLAVRPLGTLFHSPHLEVDAAELAWPARQAAAEAGGTVRHVHYRVMRRDAVGVLIHDRARDAFVLVEQYRYPAAAKGEPVLLEIPAGCIEDGESPEQTALREVREEAGATIGALEPIGLAFASPGYSDERLHLFFAVCEELVDAGGGADVGEHTRRRLVPRAEAARLLASGGIRDLKTLAALAWFFWREEAGHR